MDVMFQWSLLIAVYFNLGLLIYLLNCCKKQKVPGSSPGGPGGGPQPIPILGTVYDNTPTKGTDCNLHTDDIRLSLWEVRVTPAGTIASAILWTNADGKYNASLLPGSYDVELVIPATSTLAMCPGMANPRTVVVPETGSVIVNFALES